MDLFGTRVSQASYFFAEIVAQRTVAAGRLTELPCKTAQQLVGRKLAASLADRKTDKLLNGEVMKQRDNVGERLVECRNIWIGHVLEAAMQPIKQRMRDLVSDNIAR